MKAFRTKKKLSLDFLNIKIHSAYRAARNSFYQDKLRTFRIDLCYIGTINDLKIENSDFSLPAVAATKFNVNN